MILVIVDTLHPKRRRTTTAKAWDVESEQEEHSLSLSQHSSSSHSHSDQEQQQTPTPKIEDSATGSHGFHIFKQLNESANIRILEIPAKDIRSSTQRSPEELSSLLGAHQIKARREQYLHGNIARPSMQFQAGEQIPFVTGPMQNPVCIFSSSEFRLLLPIGNLVLFHLL